ncbi:MAG: CocE/NonD family hydrolase, partial [Actinomycetota bacterium]|nr:CocE/NonD family hydrolase [Actinomycetota bacterium]
RAGGRLDGEAPADDAAPDRFRYDPAAPTPSLGGPLLLGRTPVVDNAALEARDDVLTYTSAPLEAPLEAIGPVEAELHVRSSRDHFDVFARVCDVDAAGVSRNVCDALERVAPGRHERGPDGVVRVALALWPTAHRFAAGHAVRLQVSAGAHPRYARNLGTGEDPATATRMVAAEQEVFHDAARPSALVLPRLADGSAS